jgi:aldehyde dehydrogenase (NAD+)
MAVDGVDEAVEFINKREKPLALYVFSSNEQTTNDILANTTSGGSCVNDCIFHLANPNLPFGGVGPSGMGAYHGKSSFDEFSHTRSIMFRDTWADPGIRYPPYDDANLPMMKKIMIDWTIPETISELFPKWLINALPWLGGAIAGGMAVKLRAKL